MGRARIVAFSLLSASAAGGCVVDEPEVGGPGGEGAAGGIVALRYKTTDGAGLFAGVSLFLPSLEPDSVARPLDSCDAVYAPYIDMQVFIPDLLDAGATVDVMTPAAVMALDDIEIAGIYKGENTDTGLFVGEAVYTATAPGGDGVDPFTATLAAPTELTVTSPDLGGPVALSYAADLDLVWAAGNPADRVYVSIDQSDAEGTITSAVSCEFADDGRATLPADLLSALDPANPRTLLIVSRRTFAGFDTSIGPATFSIDRSLVATVIPQ